jgi:dihydrofolate reductase
MKKVFGTIMALACVQMPDGAIGNGDDLVWKKLAGDMDGFKIRTTDQVVIYGRKTLKSFKYRALPNRINIVVTTDPDSLKQYEGIRAVSSPLEALQLARSLWPEKDICVIGGAQIYKELFPYCEIFYVTEVFGNKEATIFIEIPGYFIEIPDSRQHGPDESIPYYFVGYGNPTPLEIPMAA